MLDPDPTNVLKRRIAAFAIDLGLVAVPTALVLGSQIETFRWETDATGTKIWTTDQLNRLRELASGFTRQFEWAQTKYVIDLGGLLLTVAVAAVLSLLIFVLVPANTGWSPGRRLFGLDRNRPRRSVSADVEERRSHRRWAADPDTHDRDDRDRDNRDLDNIMELADRVLDEMLDLDGMIDLEPRLGPSRAPVVPTPSVEDLVDATGNNPFAADPGPPKAQERWDRSYPESHFDQDLVPDEVPVDNGPSTMTDPLAGAITWEAPTAEPAPVWQPDAVEFDDWSEPLAAGVVDPADWPQPTAPTHQPAPVAEDQQRAHIQEPAETQAPAHELSHTHEPTRASDAAQAAPTAQAGEPVWNDDWQAWLFWEATSGQWLRHDEQSGRWVPIG